MSIIPRIDLTESEAEVVVKLRAACRTSGFFYLLGHGVDEQLLADALALSRDFFALPEEEKRRAYHLDGHELSAAPAFRGYKAFETVALDPHNQVTRKDLKESWSMGRDCPPNSREAIDWPDLCAANVWPSPSAPTDFRERMHTYFDAMWALGDRLRDLCALSLRLPSAEADALASAFSSPTLTLTMNHYSAERSDPSAGVLGCGAHTDYGLLTILLMDDVPALQVARTKCEVDELAFPLRESAGSAGGQGSSSDWVDVAPLPGALVVNTGDMMQRYTNGLYQSNLHRVVNQTGSERHSIAFFYEPDANGDVEVLPSCCSPDRPPQYAPVAGGYGLYLASKYIKTGEGPD